uniref:CBS domain-containing protein n=1 Tax=Ignisphaera aggregans TaxID=334771 RepID=A0A7C2Z1L8_9CREN
MSTALDIAVEPPIILKPTMRVGEVLSKLSELKIREAPVVNDSGVLVGILSYRAILSKSAGRDTKVSTVMDPPYALRANVPIDAAIARFVSWKVRDVPVINDKGRVVGYINRFMILRYLLEQGLIPNDKVVDVMSSPATTIHEGESIARARWLMIKNGFSRLPVVDRYDRVVGVITLSDIVERLLRIRLSRRKGYEWIESEESFLAAPVGDFMSSPPITIATSGILLDAARTMLDKGVTGLPVVTGDDRVAGVLSSLDILKKYVERAVSVRPIEAKIRSAVEADEFTRSSVERIVNSYLASFTRYVDILDFKITAKELKKSDVTPDKDVRRCFEVSARIATNIGNFTAKTMCWDLPTCVREAMGILEKRLRKEIEKKSVARPGIKMLEE